MIFYKESKSKKNIFEGEGAGRGGAGRGGGRGRGCGVDARIDKKAQTNLPLELFRRWA